MALNLWRILSWVIVVLLTIVPLNRLRLWAMSEIPPSSTPKDFAIGTLICWGIAGGLAYFLVVSARGRRRIEARKARQLQQLVEQPLVEIRPSKALLQPGEKAYAAAQGVLKEMKTLGYSGTSSGVSVRVAKGLTVRTGGMRGGAVKDFVEVSSGELVITDKRVIFAGNLKSFVIPLSKLVSVNTYSDGFGFSDGKSNHMVETESESERLRFAVAMDKLLQARAS